MADGGFPQPLAGHWQLQSRCREVLQVGCVRPGVGATRLEHGRIMKVTVSHQRSPENKQEGSKRPVKALPEGTRVHCSFMTDSACLLEGKKSPALVIKIKVPVPLLN